MADANRADIERLKKRIDDGGVVSASEILNLGNDVKNKEGKGQSEELSDYMREKSGWDSKEARKRRDAAAKDLGAKQ